MLYMARVQHGVTRVKTIGYIEPDPGGPIWLSIIVRYITVVFTFVRLVCTYKIMLTMHFIYYYTVI